jgi:hypothetical protein
MGDMGEYFRDWDAAKKARKAERLADANSAGWTRHTDYHWSRMLQGRRLDYWPSTGRWRWGNGITMHGDIDGFIRNREQQD